MTVTAESPSEVAIKARTVRTAYEAAEKRLDQILIEHKSVACPKGADERLSEAVLVYGLVNHNTIMHTDPRTFRRWHAQVVRRIAPLVTYTTQDEAYDAVRTLLKHNSSQPGYT